MRAACLALIVLAFGLAACLVPDVNLDGKACDTAHPCSSGFQCVQDVCLASGESPDAGPRDAGQ